jgi:geranylgeranyl pyrophosphate synthase
MKKAKCNFAQFAKTKTQRIDRILETLLSAKKGTPQNLHAAMHYSVLNGGKRLRPILIYLIGEMLHADLKQLDTAASAMELMHAASLIHDDLPAMDDDDLRRGKPTCHIAFDEATAILAGDALIILAFEILATDQHLDPTVRTSLIGTLAICSGSAGMAGGQDLDICATKKNPDLHTLQLMYMMKTGALLRACVLMGAAIARVTNNKILELLDNFAVLLGIAFQIQDDILEVESKTSIIGKNANSDKKQGKITYPEKVGIDAAKQQVTDAFAQIDTILSILEQLEVAGHKIDVTHLRAFAQYVMQRKY